MPNAWNNRLFKPKYPRIPATSYSREDDLTFSFKRGTSYPEVLNLLSRSGCFEPENYLDAIRMMRITKRTDNGQVFITTAEKGVADIWADRINAFAKDSIYKCHTYTNKEVLVHFSAIHPSVNIPKDIIQGYLLKQHGRVKDFFPQLEKSYKIPTGGWSFVMFEEDLKANPLPECILLEGVPC